MRTFKKVAGAGALMLASLAPAASHAQLLENTSFTIGLKTWFTSWNTWFNQDTSSVVGNDSGFAILNDTYNRKAQSEVTFIPQLTVRSGPWLISGSALAKKDFTFFVSQPVPGTQQLGELTFERKEYDVNLGYSLAPGATLTLGWKDLRYESSTYKYKASGPTIGFSGSAPLAVGFSIYGNFAYGRPKLTGVSETHGTYLLSEIGLAYPLSQINEGMRTTVVTAGYRYQRLSSGDATAVTYPVVAGRVVVATPIGQRAVELVDVTEGFTLGVSFTF